MQIRSRACWPGSTSRHALSNSIYRAFGCTPLKGELAGYWSITVRGNWRIIFRFEEGNATDVDLVDYH